MAGFMRKADGEEISDSESVAESLLGADFQSVRKLTNHIRGATSVARRSIIDIGGSGLFYVLGGTE